MRLFRFDPEVSHRIEHFGSSFLHQFLSITTEGELRVSVMHLGPGDHVGYHQAMTPQLFAVVAGDGWVQRHDVPLATGRAAFWSAGEWHAARTDTGLTAVVVEGQHVNPAAVMRDA